MSVTKMQHSSLLAFPRKKKKKANNWDYLIAGERQKGIRGTGVDVAIFVIFLAKFFL